jgi:hypothetical protein
MRTNVFDRDDLIFVSYSMNPQAAVLIEQLGLEPHPEGGYYRETYRAPLDVNSVAHKGRRSAYTSIYFLLAGDQYSAWHRVASDESWFFHMGSGVDILTLIPSSDSAPIALQVQTLGALDRFELAIPAGRWFAAKPLGTDGFALVSCVVAPGFVFEDFELATRQHLLDEGWDKHNEWPLIESLMIKA